MTPSPLKKEFSWITRVCSRSHYRFSKMPKIRSPSANFFPLRALFFCKYSGKFHKDFLAMSTKYQVPSLISFTSDIRIFVKSKSEINIKHCLEPRSRLQLKLGINFLPEVRPRIVYSLKEIYPIARRNLTCPSTSIQ